MDSLQDILQTGAVARLIQIASNLNVVIDTHGKIEPQRGSARYEPERDLAIARFILTLFAACNPQDRISRILHELPHLGWSGMVLYLPEVSFARTVTVGQRTLYLPLHRLVEIYYLSSGSLRHRLVNLVRPVLRAPNALLPIVSKSTEQDSDTYRIGLVDRLNRPVYTIDDTDSALVARAVYWRHLLEKQPIPLPESQHPNRYRVLLLQNQIQGVLRQEQVSIPIGWLLLQYLLRCHDITELNLTVESFKSILGAVSHVSGQMRAVHLLHAMERAQNQLLSPLELTALYRSSSGEY